jgi:hypothetical protein
MPELSHALARRQNWPGLRVGLPPAPVATRKHNQRDTGTSSTLLAKGAHLGPSAE